LLAVLLVASGCARKLNVPDGLEGAVDPTTEIGASGDVCGLLTDAEIQLALNAPVGQLQSGGRPVLVGMKMCSSGAGSTKQSPEADGPSPKPTGTQPDGPKKVKIEERQVGSQAVWGLLRKSAEKQFNAYQKRNDKYLESMKVAGHDALWDDHLRTLTVLVDKDKAFGIQLKVDNPPLPKEATKKDRRAYVKKVAELLALRALQRFD